MWISVRNWKNQEYGWKLKGFDKRVIGSHKNSKFLKIDFWDHIAKGI